MNKPVPDAAPDDEIGPVDANGQAIWSLEQEAAMASAHRDPAFWAAIEEAEEDFRAGRFLTHEESMAEFQEFRRRWLAERGL